VAILKNDAHNDGWNCIAVKAQTFTAQDYWGNVAAKLLKGNTNSESRKSGSLDIWNAALAGDPSNSGK
jgi:hypothetical protein